MVLFPSQLPLCTSVSGVQLLQIAVVPEGFDDMFFAPLFTHSPESRGQATVRVVAHRTAGHKEVMDVCKELSICKRSSLTSITAWRRPLNSDEKLHSALGTLTLHSFNL